MANNKTILKGAPIRLSAKLQKQMATEMRRLALRMTTETREEVLKVFRKEKVKQFFAEDASVTNDANEILKKLSRKYEKLFNDKAEELTDQMLHTINRQSTLALNRSLRELSKDKTFKLDTALDAQTREVLKASAIESVDLIKTIPRNYFDKLKGDVMRSITTLDGGLEKLEKMFFHTGAITQRRAKNIALDQTRKAYQSLNLAKLKGTGVKKAIWVHTGGTTDPRKKHRDFNGKVFDLDKGAPVGQNDEYVMPGQEPFCRCTFIPVIEI